MTDYKVKIYISIPTYAEIISLPVLEVQVNFQIKLTWCLLLMVPMNFHIFIFSRDTESILTKFGWKFYDFFNLLNKRSFLKQIYIIETRDLVFYQKIAPEIYILKGKLVFIQKFKTMGSQIGHVINYLNISFIAPFVSILLQDDDVFPKN